MTPGEMALTRIGASSTASERATKSTAPLVMATPRYPTLTLTALTPENSTNEPPEFICGEKCLASIVGPLTWCRTTAADSCGPTRRALHGRAPRRSTPHDRP